MRLPFRTAKEPAGRTKRRREKYGAHGSGAKNSRATVVPHTAGENEAAGRESHDGPNDEPVPETAAYFLTPRPGRNRMPPQKAHGRFATAPCHGFRPGKNEAPETPDGRPEACRSPKPYPSIQGRTTGSKIPPCRLYRHGGKRSTGSEHQSKATMRTSSSGVSIRTVIVSSGSRLSTFSGHSTRQRFPL